MKELTTEADIQKLDEVLDFIDGYLEQWNCPLKALHQINIAAEEIFVNIAHYAYGDSTGEAKISIGKTGEFAEIIFTDSGMPYDPLAKPDPDITLPAEERDVGGLGIYMVKKSMDEVSYEYKDGCNVFTMRKLIGGREN